MKKLLLIALLSSPCLAAGPKYVFEDSKLTDEFVNVYKDISTITKGNVRISSLTTTGFKVSTITVVSSATLPATTFTGDITFRPTSQGIVGTTTNDNATVGNVGYSPGAFQSITNCPASGAFGNNISISLTAGDWDISIVVDFFANGGTVTRNLAFIGTVSGNDNTGIVFGDNLVEPGLPPSSNAYRQSGSVASWRASITSTTIYYLKVFCTYTVATEQYDGRISARRVR